MEARVAHPDAGVHPNPEAPGRFAEPTEEPAAVVVVEGLPRSAFTREAGDLLRGGTSEKQMNSRIPGPTPLRIREVASFDRGLDRFGDGKRCAPVG